MPGVYAAGADHCAFAAEETALQQEHGIGFFAVLEGKDCAAEAGLYKFACCAAGGAASAGHTFEYVRLYGGQVGKFCCVSLVQIYSGTWVKCVAEFIHKVRCFVFTLSGNCGLQERRHGLRAGCREESLDLYRLRRRICPVWGFPAGGVGRLVG